MPNHGRKSMAEQLASQLGMQVVIDPMIAPDELHFVQTNQDGSKMRHKIIGIGVDLEEALRKAEKAGGLNPLGLTVLQRERLIKQRATMLAALFLDGLACAMTNRGSGLNFVLTQMDHLRLKGWL